MAVPTYYEACRIFEDSGFTGRMRAVPEDPEGIDINFLIKALERSEDQAMKEGNSKPVSAGGSQSRPLNS